ncbi:MAG: flagellar hook-basal body complex protein FliE [Actinobacteria bacterium]|nr:flagellar hook-basal body complex protein FliE [Actinomycetota bacterium]
MSALGPIAGLVPTATTTPIQDAGPGSTTGSGSGGGFGKALANAVDGLNNQINSASDQAQQLAAGQTQDLTGVVMATEQASIELEVASQIRSKAVDAYQEIFRMQV